MFPEMGRIEINLTGLTGILMLLWARLGSVVFSGCTLPSGEGPVTIYLFNHLKAPWRRSLSRAMLCSFCCPLPEGPGRRTQNPSSERSKGVGCGGSPVGKTGDGAGRTRATQQITLLNDATLSLYTENKLSSSQCGSVG